MRNQRKDLLFSVASHSRSKVTEGYVEEKATTKGYPGVILLKIIKYIKS